MSMFLKKFSSLVNGVLSGFDRIVFKGSILPLMHEAGVASFLRGKKIFNKDFKGWMTEQTERIVSHAEEFCQEETGTPITAIRSSKLRKEELARDRQKELEIAEGLLGVWSATEACTTYKARFSRTQSFPQMSREWSKCKHLYFYFDDPSFGFLNVRLQTWFPYHIQIAMNGREWLCRGLEKAGVGFDRHKNKILSVDDYQAAQDLLDLQLDTRWAKTLGQFLPAVFPDMRAILGPHLGYYWTLWQSEWATDHIFSTPRALASVGEQLLQHAFMTGTGERVLRYLDRPFTNAGSPYLSNANEVSSRMLYFQDGLRVRHWVDENSVKAYLEQNVFRVETTINNPGMFNIYRHKEGEPKDAPKKLRPMRKGVVDVAVRSKVSQQINDRLLDQVATCNCTESFMKTLEPASRRRVSKGRIVRGLEVTGKDRSALMAIADPAFAVQGITNKAIREKLKAQLTGMTEKQASAKVSRLLRLLRDHGLIRKRPRQRRYVLTTRGATLTTTLAAALRASTEELMKMAA